MESSCHSTELKQPLLDLEQVAFEAPSTYLRSLKHDLDEEHHVRSEAVDDDEANDVSLGNEGFVMWVVLPTLLFSQFGMAFLMHDERTACMSWTVVNLSIVLFVVTAWLYRHACTDANVKMIAILLMPEILMDVVLGLVLFNRVALGFMVLLASMLCLSSFVVISTAAFLYFGKVDHEEEEEEKDEREQAKTLTACQMV